jgi:flagellin
MSAGTGFEATARNAKEAVKGFQNSYFAAQASDGYLEEATTQALRMAELEGSGNTSSSEYTSVLTQVNAAAGLAGVSTITGNSSAALTAINAARVTIAGTMASALSNANIQGIKAENNFAQSDSVMGADIGAEMVNLTKYQILMQSGISAIGNANSSSQVVMGLFR